MAEATRRPSGGRRCVAMSAIAPDARSTRQMLRLSASTGSVSRPAEGAEERHPRRAPSLMMLRLSSLFEVREDGDEEAPSSVRGVESSGRLQNGAQQRDDVQVRVGLTKS